MRWKQEVVAAIGAAMVLWLGCGELVGIVNVPAEASPASSDGGDASLDRQAPDETDDAGDASDDAGDASLDRQAPDATDDAADEGSIVGPPDASDEDGSPGVPTDGLIAYYRGSGLDLSGNGNDATYDTGVTLVADRFGNPGLAGAFDGDVTTYIEVANHPLLPVGTSPRTASVWVQTNHDYSVSGSIWNWGNSTTNGERFGMNVLNNLDYFVGQFADLAGTYVLNDGAWHNIIVTYDGTTVTVLVDSVVDVSGSPTLDTVDPNLEIGRSTPDHAPEPYFGNIDQMRIYNRVLTQTELGELFSEGGWE